MAHSGATPRSTLLAVAALAFVIVIWGITPVFIRSFALAAGAADSLVIRNVLVSLLFLIFLPFFGGYHIARADWGRLTLVSLVGMLGYNIGSVFGFFYAPASIGGLIIATQPLLIAALAAMVGSEKLTAAAILGLAISFVGSLVLFQDDGVTKIPRSEILLGSGLIFLAGLAWSIYVIFSKSLIQRYGSYKISALTLTIAAPPLLVFASRRTWDVALSLDSSALFSLFFLVVIATFMSLMLWNFATGALRPTTVGASLYLVPIFAVLAGYLFLREPMTGNTLIAGSIILTGVAIAQFGPSLKWRGKLGGITAVLFAVSVWGLVPVATRFLVLDVQPQTVMILRVIPAGIIGLLAVAYMGVRPMPWSAWARIIAAAVIGNVGYQVLSIFGAQHIPASWMGMLFGLEPVFIALFAVMLAGDRVTSSLIAGLILALIGTAALMLGNLVAPAKDVGLLGIILVTMGSMGWGIYTVLIRPVSTKFGSTQVACLTLGISAFPMLLFLTPEFPQALQGMNLQQIGVMSFVVIFCTFFGTIAWNFALGHMSSALAGMFLYIQPLVAAIGGIFLLGESLNLTLVTGGAFIITGVAIAQFGPVFQKPAMHEDDLHNQDAGLMSRPS